MRNTMPAEPEYLEDGIRQDADIHEFILREGDEEAGKASSVQWAIDVLGWTEERARKAFGLK